MRGSNNARGEQLSHAQTFADEFIVQAETHAEKPGSNLGVMAAVFYFKVGRNMGSGGLAQVALCKAFEIGVEALQPGFDEGPGLEHGQQVRGQVGRA